MMNLIQASSYPHLKSQKEREKLYSFYSKRASDIEIEKKEIGLDEFSKILMQGKPNG